MISIRKIAAVMALAAQGTEALMLRGADIGAAETTSKFTVTVHISDRDACYVELDNSMTVKKMIETIKQKVGNLDQQGKHTLRCGNGYELFAAKTRTIHYEDEKIFDFVQGWFINSEDVREFKIFERTFSHYAEDNIDELGIKKWSKIHWTIPTNY